ncbi:MAG: hypothetical protein QXO02_05805 [Thermofilaceae archaeon]|uniref:hypothetical protein n=1 Tax=Pyrobaculum sp. TaxID=2004705 RepID=UPI00315FC7A4
MWHAVAYVCDVLHPVDAEATMLFTLAEMNPLRLFEKYLRPLVERCVGEVKEAEVGDIYFDPGIGLVIEYIARHSRGAVSAKLIYSHSPEKALAAYYARRGRP